MKYGIKKYTCGVYMITNKLNGKRYIGSSCDISTRCSNHMNRDARKYSHDEFHGDALKLGYLKFTFEILETCDKSDLIKREQYWYDLLKPEYNVIRPTECSFTDSKVRELSNAKSNSVNNVIRRTELYNTSKYKDIFRQAKRNIFKSVKMYNESVEITFDSMSECARWITENTQYTGKNKVSKIKAVCDGERLTAYGYKFKYNI